MPGRGPAHRDQRSAAIRALGRHVRLARTVQESCLALDEIAAGLAVPLVLLGDLMGVSWEAKARRRLVELGSMMAAKEALVA
jgi:hypothetical protein